MKVSPILRFQYLELLENTVLTWLYLVCPDVIHYDVVLCAPENASPNN